MGAHCSRRAAPRRYPLSEALLEHVLSSTRGPNDCECSDSMPKDFLDDSSSEEEQDTLFTGGHKFDLLAKGEPEMLQRPCVDCGWITGRFCDGEETYNPFTGIWSGKACFAADRFPNEQWARGQRTPLCSFCDNLYDKCHCCRKISWVTPPPFPVETN